jgi:hypothetical protein
MTHSMRTQAARTYGDAGAESQYIDADVKFPFHNVVHVIPLTHVRLDKIQWSVLIGCAP